jgi:hypothetical protein
MATLLLVGTIFVWHTVFVRCNNCHYMDEPNEVKNFVRCNIFCLMWRNKMIGNPLFCHRWRFKRRQWGLLDLSPATRYKANDRLFGFRLFAELLHAFLA